LSHYGYMKIPLRNRIAELRKARGMTQQALADAVQAHWITISKLERGRIKLTTDWLERLAPVFGVRPADLLASVRSSTGAPIGVLSEPERIFTNALVNPVRKLKDNNKFPKTGGTVVVDSSDYEPFLREGDRLEISTFEWLGSKERREGALCFLDNKSKSILGFAYAGPRAATFDLFWLGRRLAKDIKPGNLFSVTSVAFRT
jgi:transcriptional regulator with XRE-family HTH domain